MLLNLYIKNYALIDDLSIRFSPGLNILTGETGAGKSIIIDAINLIIGERAYADLVRSGKKNASVEAVFEYDDISIDNLLKDYGIEPEDNILLICREVYSSGRSISRVNGKIVPASFLKKIGKFLVDIHGQHQHQSLLDSKNHGRILDLLGGKSISKIKDKVCKLYNKFKYTQSEIETLKKEYKEFCKRQEILKYELDELEKANLKPEEDVILEENKKMLENAEKIFTALDYTYNVLYKGYETSAILDNINNIIDTLDAIRDIFKPAGDIIEPLQNIYYELEDLSNTVRNLREDIDFNMANFDEINKRLALIDRLKAKYNKSLSELISYKKSIAAELDKASDIDEQTRKLQEEYKELKSELSNIVIELHENRVKIATQLEENISKELKDLGMKNVKFKVNFSTEDDPNGIEFFNKSVRITENGIDKIEFLISTNPEEPLKPLSKIVSGGECSRIMLALKSILATVDNISCLIFDEIDTGIGGRTAQVVGEKLSKISREHQILCVTHSPQIASLGDSHFLIKKENMNGKNHTTVQCLQGDERIKELARMLGGAQITKNTLAHAQEMLIMAKDVKNAMM